MAKRTLQESILIRALGEKGYKEVYQQYCDARFRNRPVYRPTDNQIRLASLAKKVGYKLASQQAGVDIGKVYGAVARVSKYEYLTN